MEMKHRLPGALSIVLQKIEAIRVKSVEQLLRYLLRNARRTAESFRPELIFRQWEDYVTGVIAGKEHTS